MVRRRVACVRFHFVAELGDTGCGNRWRPVVASRNHPGMTSQPDENLPTRWMKSTGYRDMWVDTEEDPRETGAEDATDERGVLLD